MTSLDIAKRFGGRKGLEMVTFSGGYMCCDGWGIPRERACILQGVRHGTWISREGLGEDWFPRRWKKKFEPYFEMGFISRFSDQKVPTYPDMHQLFYYLSFLFGIFFHCREL